MIQLHMFVFNGLFSLLNSIDIYVDDNCYNTHFIEPLFCQLNTNNIILNNNVFSQHYKSIVKNVLILE